MQSDLWSSLTNRSTSTPKLQAASYVDVCDGVLVYSSEPNERGGGSSKKACLASRNRKQPDANSSYTKLSCIGAEKIDTARTQTNTDAATEFSGNVFVANELIGLLSAIAPIDTNDEHGLKHWALLAQGVNDVRRQTSGIARALRVTIWTTQCCAPMCL